MKNFLISLLMVCSTAQAQFQSGNDLHKDIHDSSPQSNMYALGYIVGVTDAFIGTAICIPQGVSQGQLMDVVKNFLNRAPQARNLPANVLVMVAVEEHWPCPKGKKRS